MRCIVLLYTFCLYFLLFELVPTGSSEVRRIIGGHDADEHKYQYVVRLQYEIVIEIDGIVKLLKYSHACTAAVITPIWSLTAAHCLDEEGPLRNAKLTVSVKVKSVVIHGPLERQTICKVIRIVRHPAFKFRLWDLYNDIALIRHETITLKEYARVSGLDYRTMVGQEVIMTGYGITNTSATVVESEIGNPKFIQITKDATSLEIPLQYLDAVVVQCDKNTKSPLKGGMCLARSCSKLSGLCPGDSGGPVLHESGVVGVNTIGSKQINAFCFLHPHPVFYDPAGITPTSPYIDWISRTIFNEVPERKSIMHELPKRGMKGNEFRKMKKKLIKVMRTQQTQRMSKRK